MKQTIHNSGKRKAAIARATITPGKGMVRINHIPIDLIQPKLARMKIKEPILLAGETMADINIDVLTQGGGAMSQAMAARLSIGRVLTEYNPSLKESFLSYDRQLTIADVRYKETRKPNRHGKARAKRQKSYR